MTEARETETAGAREWHPLHPLSPFIRTLHFVVVALVLAVQQIGEIFGAPLVALSIFGAGITVAALYGFVSYKWTGFRVTADQIELKTGVLFRQHRRIPVDRIEAIDISRPLVARVFGLVELRTEVVSGGGSEMKFQYLDQHDALALREFVLQLRNGQSGAQMDGESAKAISEQEERVLLEVPARRIFVAYGAVRVAFTVLIAGMGLLLGIAIDDGLIVGIAISAPPVVLAILVTTAKVIENFWGFRVSYDERGIVVRRGFLNELTQKVPVARIQGIRIEEPWLWRFAGYGRLIVDVAGYRNTATDGTAETAVLAPIATRSEIHDLLTHFVGNSNVLDLPSTPPPAKAKWRSPFAPRLTGIAGDGTWAISHRGFIRKQIDIVAHRKTQSLRVTQGPWQRRLGLASLHIDTAGSRIRFVAAHRDFDEAHILARQSRQYAADS